MPLERLSAPPTEGSRRAGHPGKERPMSDNAETAASRLWRDQVHLREEERDEAGARARIAEEKVAILTAENDRLADEIARLRALLAAPDAAPARAETEKQMEDLRTALLSLIDQPEQPSLTSRRSRWWSSWPLSGVGTQKETYAGLN
jgi:hypothetical protein